MSRRLGLLVLALALLCGMAVGLVAAETLVEGSPDIEVNASANIVGPGEEVELPLSLNNIGQINESGDPAFEDRVRTARAVRMTVEAGDAPVTVRTDSMPVGTVPEGAAGPFGVAIIVDTDAEPGTYELDVELNYTYTEEVELVDGEPVFRDTRTTSTDTVTIRVDDRARFEVVDSETDSQVGDRGTTRVTLQNVGGANATDATIEIHATDDAVLLGAGSPVTRTFGGAWAVGENRTVSLTTEIVPDTTARPYTLDAIVAYEDPRGVDRETAPVSFGIEPAAEQAFAVENVSSTLRVDGDGTVTGTVTNEGPRAVQNLVLRYQDEHPDVTPRSHEYTVGDLDAGETAEFSFELTVRADAEPGPRTLRVAPEYRNDAGDKRFAADHDLPVTVGEEVEPFAVHTTANTVDAGGETVLRLEVENTGDERVTDVRAKLLTRSPLDSNDDTAFIQALEPGETRELIFHLSADGNALAKNYHATIDFRYEDHRGNSRLSDAFRVPVEVTDDRADGLLDFLVGWPGAVLLGLVLLAAGAVAHWRRSRPGG